MSTDFKRPAWVRAAVAAGGEFHSMKKDPGPHNARNAAALGVVVAVFVGVTLLAAVLPPLVWLPLAVVTYGCVYFSVNILVIHECSHSMFVLSRDRAKQKRMNRAIGRLAAMPFFTDYVNHWEKGHTVHHLRPCEPDDPQDNDPLTGPALWRRYALLALVPFSFVPFNPSRQYPGAGRRALVGTLLWWVPLAAITGPTLGWHVIVAMLLGLHVTMILNWTKKAQEHGAGLAHEPDYMLRSRTYFYATAPVTSPFNINYHFEHHANFNVPWYDLPAYHAKLQAIVPGALKPYYFHHDFMAQLNGTKPLPPRELLVDAPVAVASR